MKKIILYGSLALNIFMLCELKCWIDVIDDCTVCETHPDSMSCPCSSVDTYRYRDEQDGGGVQVSREAAQTSLERFHERFPECTMSGGWISKRSLDALFCADSTWNGIYCYMGMPTDTTFTMIFEGNHFKGSLMKREDSVGMKFFQAETLCPDDCGDIR